MKKHLTILFLFGYLAPQFSALADDYTQNEILTIDEPISELVNLEFSNGDDLVPKLGEFKVMSAILMSNLSGERWATVTIKNTAAHQRLLDREHIMAIFANGERRQPIQAEHKFSGNEEVTLIIGFGKSKFPILRVSVRNTP
ncbi:MAG: hypothetical protein OEX12_04035 [Gammaproteobacteria bacterium]|nr:hypothetical protein [Gammaproteobacteria bacterium]